jgi:hypothetical protein
MAMPGAANGGNILGIDGASGARKIFSSVYQK